MAEPPIITPEQWAACVAAVDEARITELAKWRGWLRATCYLLRDHAVIGIYKDCWAFPNIDQDGDIVSVHYRLKPQAAGDKANWRHSHKGVATHALVFGDLFKADAIAIFESQWDAITLVDKLNFNPFVENDWTFVSTRGASGAKTLNELGIPDSVGLYLFPQNDEAGTRWTLAVLDVLGREAYMVPTPAPHKDLGEWGLNGLDRSNLLSSIKGARLRRPAPNAPQQNVAPGPDLTDEELRQFDSDMMERLRTKDRPFPAPMDDAAFYGLAGEIVTVLAQDTEPCRESLLAQFLVAIGNVIGRSAHCRQGGTHHLNEFAVLIGETARGRKGTSWGAIENLIKTIDPNWVATRVRSGFQSGESIINAVRDQIIGTLPLNKGKPGQPTQTVTDPGVSDKRLLILEEEFARLLIVGGRKENTLFSALRNAWDAKEYLYTEAKNSAQKATGALVSMIGHVTAAELIKTLHQVEHLSGFSNRFLWVAVQRTKVIPLPTWIDWQNYPDLIKRLTDIIGTFKIPGRRLHWSDSGKAAWHHFYHSIKVPGNSGVLGSIIARCDAHTLRLAMLYAVLDHSLLMTAEHLAAAIAFWQYCQRSAAWALGQQTGNRMADRILWALQHEPSGITRTDIRENVFSKNCTNTLLDIAFEALVNADLAYVKHERIPGARRTIERWFATKSL